MRLTGDGSVVVSQVGGRGSAASVRMEVALPVTGSVTLSHRSGWAVTYSASEGWGQQLRGGASPPVVVHSTATALPLMAPLTPVSVAAPGAASASLALCSPALTCGRKRARLEWLGCVVTAGDGALWAPLPSAEGGGGGAAAALLAL